ncbi:MAG: zinc-binding alcohol dehydrogenase family protein [Candidatus Eremiobacteraeota bacterium]|nr:zinc-binding alcohol dehydrogenase family protein [Candidatus Eremiobacteraeota bacterium]
MKAWLFDRYGEPSVLRLEERPMPVVGPGEVLIEVLASGINPSDVKNLAGLFKSPLPRVPGRDYAGVIAGGDGKAGEEVWGSGPAFGVARDGADAQYIVVPSSWISRKPSALSMAEAATIGVPYLAAWWTLVETARIASGETVLVTGVSGAVGGAATQIAHARGARVIGADRSKENPSGADAMIDTTDQDLAQGVMALTSGKGVEVSLDTVGGTLFEASLKSLARGGRQLAIASSPQVVSFNLVDFYHGLKQLIGIDTMALTGEQIAATMDELRVQFENGKLHPPEIRTWPFERAVEAYEAVANHEPPLKHVLLVRG